MSKSTIFAVPLALLLLNAGAVGADPSTAWNFYGKPRPEIIIEPCAADFSCVVFDGSKLELTPVSHSYGDFDVVAKKATPTLETYVVKATLVGRPVLAVVTRDPTSGKTKIAGIDRNLPKSSEPLTNEQIAGISDLVKDKNLKIYLTSTDPVARGAAAKAITSSLDTMDQQIKVDLAVLHINNLFTGQVYDQVVRLQMAVGSVIARECFSQSVFKIIDNMYKNCGYYRTMSDAKPVKVLQAQIARKLGAR